MGMAGWAPIAAAGIQAGGSLLGGMFGSAGQASANAQQFSQNEMMMGQQQAFAANQADIANNLTWDMQTRAQDFTGQQTAQAITNNWQMMGEQEKYGREMQDRQNAFNVTMANSAWQRGVADMKAAGINPILAASLGGAPAPTSSGGGSIGFGTPAGSSSGGSGTAASSSAPSSSVGNPGESMGRGIASSAAAAKTYFDLQQLLKGIEKTDAAIGVDKQTVETQKSTQDYNTSAARVKDAEADLTKVLQDKARQDTATSAANAAAANAAANDSNAGATYKAAQTIIAGHEAHSAAERAKQEALKTNQYGVMGVPGGGLVGETAATVYGVGRSIKSGAEDVLGSLYDVWKNRDTIVPPIYSTSGHDRPAR